MARLDVRRGRNTGGLFLEVQADHLSHLKTRLVVPLTPIETDTERLGALHPLVSVAGEQIVLTTHLVVAVLASDLTEVVARLDDDYHIIRALDVLIGTA